MFKINVSEKCFSVNTDKFKDFILSVRFTYPNTEPNVTLSNLLSYMITDRSEKYPSKQDMSLKMDELFGLSLNAKTSSFGYAHTLEIRIKTLNQRYTDLPHLKDATEFLYSSIINPLFNETTFNEAKINLEATLKRIQDKPSYLGILKACEGIGKDTPLSTFSQGSLDVLKNVKLNDVIEFHKMLILTVKPKVLMMGDLDTKLKNDLLKILDFKSSYKVIKSIYKFEANHHFRSTLNKQFDQSTLTQLYTTNVLYSDNLYFALRVMVIMLGQLPNSLLFQEVREKRSLCYSISAGSFNYDGIMSIQTGIEFSKKELVERLIEEQIIKLRKGKFSKRLLTIAKKMFVNGLESMVDDQNAYLNFLFQRSFTNNDFDLNKSISKIKNISKEDIVQVANQLLLVSEFMIRGKN
jgi:predicted Zn-dependent peptidase